MEHSGNISIFNIPGTFPREHSPDFHWELLRIFREYIMFYEYSTSISFFLYLIFPLKRDFTDICLHNVLSNLRESYCKIQLNF